MISNDEFTGLKMACRYLRPSHLESSQIKVNVETKSVSADWDEPKESVDAYKSEK